MTGRLLLGRELWLLTRATRLRRQGNNILLLFVLKGYDINIILGFPLIVQ